MKSILVISLLISFSSFSQDFSYTKKYIYEDDKQSQYIVKRIVGTDTTYNFYFQDSAYKYLTEIGFLEFGSRSKGIIFLKKCSAILDTKNIEQSDYIYLGDDKVIVSYFKKSKNEYLSLNKVNGGNFKLNEKQIKNMIVKLENN
jgi:hypothetical protein